MTFQKISQYRTIFFIIGLGIIGLVIIFLFLIYFQPNIIIKAIAYRFKDEPILFYPDAYYSTSRENQRKLTENNNNNNNNNNQQQQQMYNSNQLFPFFHRTINSLDDEFEGKFYEENEKVVALTIDDGLSSYTNEILDILDKYNSQATFFLIGRHLERYSNSNEIIDKILDLGNELGNHMWRDEPSINLDFSEFETQLLKVDKIINQSYNRYYNRNAQELLFNSNQNNNNNNNKINIHNNNNQINNNNNQIEIKKYLNYCKNASSEYQLHQHLLERDEIDDDELEDEFKSFNNLGLLSSSSSISTSVSTHLSTIVSSQQQPTVPPQTIDNNILSKCNIRKRKLFRPGSGFFNREMIEIIKKHEYILCLGNVYPHDPFITIPSINSWHVLANISPGSVIILHDREHTIETLNTILPKLISDGYKITTLSNLLDKENLFMK